MKIEKKRENNVLTIFVDGRLDTNTVQELDQELTSLDGVEKLIFDFEKLEYISSSGLRLILKYKKMKNSTKVINCNAEVYEIFNLTGFAEIMDVEKALRKISIEGCEKIGEGFFGNIYRIDDETIVKVYKVPDSLDLIKRERELAKRAFVLGIPTAIPYDIVKVDNLYGAVFELLNAESIVNLINSDKDLDVFAKKSADILKNMHKKELGVGELPSRKKHIMNILKECESAFSRESFEKLLILIDTIPETNTLLHCDFHIKNIMSQNNDLLIIDMDNLSLGHPIFEFGAMYATYNCYSCVDKKNTDKFLGMPLETTNKLFNKIFKYYYDNKSDLELDEIKLKISIISYIQVLSLRTKYSDNSNSTYMKEIEFCKQYLSENAKKLETLNY